MARVFSGIQPTGRKHLGNYIGAIRQYVADQSLGEAIYCIVDLHSISVPYEAETLADNTLDTAATLLAAGLDPARCTLFVQSQVPEHTEGCWLLSAVATMGELQRMVQFKEKSEGKDSVSLALFELPGAAGGGHPALPDRPRSRGRRPAPARRAGAQHRPAVQPPVRRDAAAAGGGRPVGRRPGHGTCRSRPERRRPPGHRARHCPDR